METSVRFYALNIYIFSTFGNKKKFKNGREKTRELHKKN
jgi:hypothetical protein